MTLATSLASLVIGWSCAAWWYRVTAAACVVSAFPVRVMRAAYAAGMAVGRGSKARAARRRKRRMARVEHDLSDGQWIALQAAWGGCAYCGATDKPLQRDCILPISRGGRYTLDNVVPACPSCNTSKCNDEVTGWLRRKRLDERAFLLRLIGVRIALGPQLPAEPDASSRRTRRPEKPLPVARASPGR
jgi:HNH endonuclease